MNVLIAKNKEECLSWKNNAVVVDVLNAATTACVLTKGAKTDMVVLDGADKALAFKGKHPEFELYSACAVEGVSYQADSPYLASKKSSKSPAILLSPSLAAVFALRQAHRVFLGGFCNFYTLATVLKSLKEDVLLVPAALWGGVDDVEDALCVNALKDFIQGFGRAENAVEEIKTTMRYLDFRKKGPKTVEKDIKIAFSVNEWAVVPAITFAPGEDFAVCHDCTQAAPSYLLTINQPAPEPVCAPAPKEPSVPEESAQKAVPAQEPNKEEAGNATSKLKKLFNELIKTVKEEANELERSFSGETPPKELMPHSASQSDDPLGAILKETAPEEGAAVAASAPVLPTPHLPVSKEAAAPVLAAEVTFSGKAAAFGDKKKKKAIILFSGGLDSTTCLYWALAQGYECEALSVSYGQRHDREVISAEFIAKKLGIKHHVITLNLPWLSCCSLVDKNKELPDIALKDIPNEGIPSTYVPGRNLMFMSMAASLLDAVGADAIIAGPNAVDFSGYPDCTPAFFKSAAEAINRGTKMGVSEGVEVLAPLMRLSKAQIVQLAAKLKVPFDLTWSCYAGGAKPCGHCDSCKLRAKGFAEAGMKDTAVEE